MKKYFDDLWKQQDITEEGENLVQDTDSQIIKKEKQMNFDVYKQIQTEQEKKIQSTYQQITNTILEKMNSFKSENKIQKKIMQKYQQKLDNLMKTEELDCKLKIQNLIQKYEGEYQQKKGYVQIDNFIQTVLSDEQMKKDFQGNDEKIKQEFQKIWEQYLSETDKASEQQYLEMVDTQYKAIKSITNQFILNTKNESEYFNYFRDVLIKQNPNEEVNKEQEKILNLFMQELKETEQFIFIYKNSKQTLAYLDIFQQKISEKLEKSKDQLLDMNSFYSQSIKFQVVAKHDIEQYLNCQFEKDFQNLLQCYDQNDNKKNQYLNFISILHYLKIEFDKQSKDELDKIIINPTVLNQIKQYFDSKKDDIQKQFQNLKKTLKFNHQQEIDLTGIKFASYFKKTYQINKVPITSKINTSKESIQYIKKEIQQNFIIIDTEFEILSIQNDYQESFDYIMSPQTDIPYVVRQNFPKQLNKIMIESNGWNKLYNELYNLIKQEICYSKSKVESQKSNSLVYINNDKEDDNIQSFNPYLITGIIQKVENNIKVKYNNQFAQFGVILTDVGERCIYYYSMLIIWRYFCYQRWNSKNIQQKHQNNYQKELTRCIAEINQDNEKQSQIKATEFFSKIQSTIKNQFLNKTKKEVLQKMSTKSMTNFDLIAKLDQELLIDINEKTFKDQQKQQKIISYTTDHKSYINQYVQDILSNFSNELLNEYQNKYRQELSQYLKSIQENVKKVYKYIQHQKKDIKTFQYFQEENNFKEKICYENYIFRLLMQCLHGKIEDNIDIIENQYKEIFQSSNYNPVNNIINWQQLNPQDQQVYNLKTFVKTLSEQIDKILKNIDQIKFNQSEYELDVEFGKLRLQMNGCEYTCPCCKRKCDKENDNNHIHQCLNGHQIRGINGILINKDSPSLFTCEEILDDWTIKTLETNLQKTWKEVKKVHSNWNFHNLNNDEQNKKNKTKWRNVWNKGLGKLICQHLEKQLNYQVIFSQKQELHSQVSNIHYILILDDSGSMQGTDWDNAKNGALNCIKSLENTDGAKVSVIIFNNNARIVAECQKPNYREMNKKIVYSGGGTSFEPPFKQALELIKKYHNFNKIQILFSTDGDAGYPQNAVDNLCQLQQDIRRLISIIVCSGDKQSQTLALIIEKFKVNVQSAELRNSITSNDLLRVWTEVVSQNIHQQLA